MKSIYIYIYIEMKRNNGEEYRKYREWKRNGTNHFPLPRLWLFLLLRIQVKSRREQTTNSCSFPDFGELLSPMIRHKWILSTLFFFFWIFTVICTSILNNFSFFIFTFPRKYYPQPIPCVVCDTSLSDVYGRQIEFFLFPVSLENTRETTYPLCSWSPDGEYKNISLI